MATQEQQNFLGDNLTRNFKNRTFLKVSQKVSQTEPKPKTVKNEYKLSGAASNFGPKNRGIMKEGKIVHQLAPGQKVLWTKFVDPQTKAPKFTDVEIKKLTESADPDYFVYDMNFRIAGWKKDVERYLASLGATPDPSTWITGANYKDRSAHVKVPAYWDAKGAEQGAATLAPPDLIAWEKKAIGTATKAKKDGDETVQPLPLGSLAQIYGKIRKISGKMMSDIAEGKVKGVTFANKDHVTIPDVIYVHRDARVGGAHGMTLQARLAEIVSENAGHSDGGAWKYLDVSAVNEEGGRGKTVSYNDIDMDGKSTRKTRVPISRYVGAEFASKFKYWTFNASYDPTTNKYKYASGLQNAISTLGITGITAQQILDVLPKDRKGRASSAKSASKTLVPIATKTVLAAPIDIGITGVLPSMTATARQ
jgi:hypothetical protein